MRILIPLLLLAVVGGVVYYVTLPNSHDLVLTGIVTTDDVIVSSQITGRLQQVMVKEGDPVTANQLLATIQSDQQQADLGFYTDTQQQDAALVKQAQADLESARLLFERDEPLYKSHAVSGQDYDQARLAYEGAKMRVEGLKKQAEAAAAELEKSRVQLGYANIVAPIVGIVDKRVALAGEVVNSGQPIVTLINPDDLWVRADVEESYIDRIRLGDTMQVKLPSGQLRQGTVFYRGVDGDFATQRDVSRTKRDIKTFQIRLRCDNKDRALAPGMTAYVTLPLHNK
jgi:RND family efflux transporter MFP subunit